MKKVLYVSLSANSWQRAALLDSAIELASSGEAKVSFLQLYQSENSLIDLPISSFLDYSRAKWQDERIKQKMNDDLFEILPLRLGVSGRAKVLGESARKVGLEETIVKTRDSRPCDIHAEPLIAHYAERYSSFYESAKTFLEEISPDLIYVFNGRFYREKAFWQAALDLGIAVNFIERFSPNWHDRYFEFEKPVHSIAYRCEVMKVFAEDFANTHGDTSTLEIAAKWFEDRVAGVGQNFTSKQNEVFKGSFPYSRQIVFFHSSEDELFTTDLGSSYWEDQISFLKEFIKYLETYPKVILIVRLHPNLAFKSPREIRRWKNFAKSVEASNVIFLMQDSPVRSYDLLKSSDCVITFGSTIGVEATHLKKPSFLVSRAFHEQLNVTRNVNKMHELIEEVLEPSKITSTKDLYKNTVPYGLFHAIGGIRFRHLTPNNRKIEQDQSFQLYGICLGTLRIISLIRRIEGALYKTLGFFARYDCNCQCFVKN